MFKYLRMMNSNISAPEITRVEIDRTGESIEPLPRGAIFTRSPEGYLSKEVVDTKKPKYLLLEDITADTDKTDVACIRIQPGMVFEADVITDDPLNNMNGAVLAYYPDPDTGITTHCGYNNGTDLEYLDVSRRETDKKIIVTTL
jgi:hypothetical protein